MHSLRIILSIIKKDLFSTLLNPAFYIAAIIFCIGTGVNFFILQDFFVVGKGSSDLRLFFFYFPYVSILVIPVLTMNLWTREIGSESENSVSSSIPIINLLPVSSKLICFAKWISSLLSFMIILIGTFVVPVIVSKYGDVDFNLVFTAYFGIVFYAGTTLAIGQFFSILTLNQTFSFILTAIVLAIFNGSHVLPLYFNMNQIFVSIFQSVSFAWHFDRAGKGIIDSRDLLFYVSITAFFLLWISFVIEKRKMD